MSIRISAKRGDTFLLGGTVKTGGVAQNLTGWTIRAQIRDGATLLNELAVTYVDRAAGIYSLRTDATSSWPSKTLKCDIQYTTNENVIMSTETFDIVVAADVTY